jgi:hypothetical protein
MYAINSMNSNYYYGTKQTPVKMQYKNIQQLYFKGNFGDFFDGFSKIPKEKQQDFFKELLVLSKEKNPDLLNKLRHQLGLKSNTKFDWQTNVYKLDLSEHTAEEHASSLLEHLIPKIKIESIQKQKKIYSNEDEYIFIVDNFRISFTPDRIYKGTDSLQINDIKQSSYFRDVAFIALKRKNNSLMKFDLPIGNQINSSDKKLNNLFEQIKRKMLGEVDFENFEDFKKNVNQQNIPKQPPKKPPLQNYRINVKYKSSKDLWMSLCKIFHPDYANLNQEFSSYDLKRSETYMKAVNSIGKDNLTELQKLVEDWNFNKETPSYFDKKRR